MMTLKSRIEQLNPLYLFFSLSLIFFVFYLIQIPFWTRYPDVLVHSCRSLSDLPILNYAYLDERSLYLYGTKALPNYHLGHTVLLWFIYHIVPKSLAITIWPSGFLASICGSLVVGFTFLIWLHLGLQKYNRRLPYLGLYLYLRTIGAIVPSLKEHPNLLVLWFQ